MKQLNIESLQKIHNRNLDICSYIVDDEHLLITGQLQEKYLVDTCWAWRKDGPLVKDLNG